ncbi:hypothetical protein [Oceanibaculum indicum]|uniref:Uncharacterized protein n=1 Tax=Oceanibaculum indicum P24 TaxID=1207063 RepID=K2JK15_9PROT|nr:hypothetical protein [Oceanibaculum indicum]EKE70904.1 hypothetical protein P24_15214 [Oceanibaculum indicum P24]
MQNARAAGLGSGVVATWLWGVIAPEQPMPPEVGAALAALLMGAADAIGGWMSRRLDRGDHDHD